MPQSIPMNYRWEKKTNETIENIIERRKKEFLPISDESTAVRKLSKAVHQSTDIAAVDNEIFNQFDFNAHSGISIERFNWFIIMNLKNI